MIKHGLLRIVESIKRTEQKLKHDSDSHLSEVYRLRTCLNFLHYFPEAAVEQSPSSIGRHFQANTPSNLQTRRALGDCRGRLAWSEARGGDVIFKKKGAFQMRKINGERRLVWVKKPEGYTPVDPQALLALPFTAKLPRGVFRK